MAHFVQVAEPTVLMQNRGCLAAAPMPSLSPTRILAVNSGSSSLKYAVYERRDSERRLAVGTIGQAGNDGARALLEAIAPVATGVTLVGHRIVHGGPRHMAPEIVTSALLRDLRRLAGLDPEHLPPALEVLEALRRRLPAARHYACFDTAFHRDLPAVARRFALPARYDRAGVRRYGFHGLSYEYLMEELERMAGRAAARGRVLLAHLGSGASLAAVKGGRPVDTTMGFMPSGGLMMATRCGDIDPGALLRIAEIEWKRPAFAKASAGRLSRLSHVVNQESGLLGVSGYSADLRDVMARARRDPRCRLAADLFAYTAVKFAGALVAAMGGVDTLVFSGGIGEHSPWMRRRIAAGLAFAGVKVDRRRNRRGEGLISPPRAGVAVRVIPTDEERMIARAGARLFA